jgi:putative endopeptidase
MLSSELDTENFNFYGNYLYGQEVQQPRWRRILDATSGCLGEAIGQLYVEKNFPTEAKERMLNLVGNLRVALGERIKNLDWMSDETKAKALVKLDAFNVKIGYPDKWKDYSKYEVTPESYFQNVHRAIRFETEREMAKIGKPVDKEEWFMTPQTVNAYYSPEMNEIVFPAAILQPPFFNMDADDAVNYGGIGVVIGHEMTHGFDDQGCKYDEKGNLNNWWTEDDAAKFGERTAQLAKLFDEFQVRGYQINGQLTLGENIADLGGLNVAWDAYQMTDEAKANKSIDGYTPAQRFFISYGTIWRNNSRDKYIERQVKTDVHSPAEARVNRTLGSMPHFYEAFDIQPENAMYIAPEERATIW